MAIGSSAPPCFYRRELTSTIPTATPTMEMMDKTVIKFRFFLLRKYLPAINELVFNMQKSILVFGFVFFWCRRNIEVRNHLVHILGISSRIIRKECNLGNNPD